MYTLWIDAAELHRKGTGVSNELILENLKNLSGRADIIVRIPVIGGYNDNDEEIRQIADFLKQIKIIKAELLQYHAMGEHKYTALGRNTESFNVPNKNFMNRAQQLLSIIIKYSS